MELQTERTILRHWQENDAEALYNIASNPKIGLNAGWKPHTCVEYSREIIRKILSSEKEFYAIVLKETNELSGCAGFLLGEAKHSKTMGNNDAEAGYWIGVPYWGQGLIPEAMRELVRHGFEDLGLDAIWAGHYNGNLRSKRVADKLGFTYQHTEEENEKDSPLHLTQDILFYRITKQEWAKNKEI
ncbi:MAG: GNAT family N-acetyltransferase [Prevotellaceae bacterium]|jgi:RimJ/RimL family protein N-acetyltransferase|nr:GNAT family N-acetyltransferase [Prevotellaceae bacterium]